MIKKSTFTKFNTVIINSFLSTNNNLITSKSTFINNQTYSQFNEIFRIFIKDEFKIIFASTQLQNPSKKREKQNKLNDSKSFNNIINIINNNNQSRFNIQNLEFFYFNVSKSYNFKYIIHNHKKTIFKTIYTFNKRVYNYVLFINEIIIKKNLSFYFQNSTLN